jgi:putative IMPACT (imprinted ancient) family translation regulator
MTDAYQTIESPTSARIRRKKSRFIAQLHPVSSVEGVDDALRTLRRIYHDASHYCFAYRLIGDAGPISTSDDAGEPAGSAGLPILHRLEEKDLLNVLGVVVRYFGGAKLGIGGLRRAYSDALLAAMARARIIVRRIEVDVFVAFPPEVTSAVMGTIRRHGAEIRQMEYDTQGNALVALLPSQVEEFVATLREATGARATVEVMP